MNIAREIYPDIKGVFVDTGLEFPEVKGHVKSFDNIVILRPEKSFLEVIQDEGWVYPSKEVALDIYYRRKGSQWAINTFQGLDNKGNTRKER
jgi:3'-phosphoadenosine 5'-phosphosulfate sulfotransferase (PAPS reductase)/FAD synthetase